MMDELDRIRLRILTLEELYKEQGIRISELEKNIRVLNAER